VEFLVDCVLAIAHCRPGLARRTHDTTGRMRTPLRVVLAAVGIAAVAGGVWVIGTSLRGFDYGRFGFVLASLIGLGGGAILAGGLRCIVRAVRNPSSPLPANVVPFHRPAVGAREHGSNSRSSR
jgi:hypothetical protein